MLSHAKLAAQREQRNWETLKAGEPNPFYRGLRGCHGYRTLLPVADRRYSFQAAWKLLRSPIPILFTADYADVTQRMPIRFRLSYAFFALLAVKSEFQPQRTSETHKPYLGDLTAENAWNAENSHQRHPRNPRLNSVPRFADRRSFLPRITRISRMKTQPALDRSQFPSLPPVKGPI